MAGLCFFFGLDTKMLPISCFFVTAVFLMLFVNTFVFCLLKPLTLIHFSFNSDLIASVPVVLSCFCIFWSHDFMGWHNAIVLPIPVCVPTVSDTWLATAITHGQWTWSFNVFYLVSYLYPLTHAERDTKTCCLCTSHSTLRLLLAQTSNQKLGKALETDNLFMQWKWQ